MKVKCELNVLCGFVSQLGTDCVWTYFCFQTKGLDGSQFNVVNISDPGQLSV